MKITKFGKPALWRSIAAVSSIVLCLAVGGTVVTTEWSGYINKYLGISNTTIVQGDSDEDPIHYKSDYSSYTEVMNNAREVAKQVQAEGTVLMVNDDENGLPLEKNSNVTFFGYNQVDIAYGGTGSGGVTPSAEREVDLISACEGKLGMNKTIYDFYQDKYDNKVGFVETTGWGGTTMNFRTVNSVNEINAADFTQEVKDSYADYGDAAIYIITRIGGEGSDLSTEGEGYLALDENERSVLEEMKAGDFDKRIVILNTFNAMELGWVEEYDIDAVLYIGGPGEVGMDAVTDILIGEINPSGHLADTYAYDSFSSPAMQNFGDFEFANSASITNSDSRKYVMYNEGIYVGYRYYETRYEDTVLGNGDASSSAGVYASSGSSWKYEDEVQFPFGWGMSYSDFTQTLDSVEVDWDNKTAEVTVTVTNNTPDIPGKDVVQVYAQAPYTVGGVEKSAIQLCGFAKTQTLDSKTPSQTLTITVDLADIASYDYENYKTYIMDAGDYYFAIGDSAHDALNNVLAAKGYTTSDGMDENGDKDKAYKSAKTDFDPDEYRLSSQNTSITNQFDSADLNYYDEDAVTYLSRSDWDGTWPETMSGYTATQSMIDAASSYYVSATDGSQTPSAYTAGSSDTSSITTGAEAQYTLAMMIGADYDDEAWDALLDQITVQEYLDSTKQGRSAITSVGLPATTAVDGPAAWTKSYYITDYTKQYLADEVEVTEEQLVAYPTETVIAGTWNVDLIETLGESFGEEGLWGGGVGWYGPAANTHRTPYAGRNFEYYSEDGFISGKLCEAEVHGAMSKGVISYLKHFFLNDQETNRIGVCTFSNEQAIREVYMRAFEYAFETTGEDYPACNGVMGGFNRLGMTWTGHYSNLWKNVMENEWGFLGNVTTDFGQKANSLMEPRLAYEAGTHMFCTSGSTFSNYLTGADITSDLTLMSNMREAIHRQLYNFANSAAMNGSTSDSKIVTVRVWYENALLAATIISAVVFAGSAAMVALQTFLSKKDKKEAEV